MVSTVNLISTEKTLSFTITGEGATAFMSDFLQIFSPTKEEVHFLLETLQYTSKELNIGLEGLIEKYKDSDIKVFNLRDYFKRLPEGSPFFVILNEIDEKTGRILTNYLISLNDANPKEAFNILSGIIASK